MKGRPRPPAIINPSTVRSENEFQRVCPFSAVPIMEEAPDTPGAPRARMSPLRERPRRGRKFTFDDEDVRRSAAMLRLGSTTEPRRGYTTDASDGADNEIFDHSSNRIHQKISTSSVVDSSSSHIVAARLQNHDNYQRRLQCFENECCRPEKVASDPSCLFWNYLSLCRLICIFN